MVDYYKLDIIPIILSRFKVDNVVISGVSDEKIVNCILEYCNSNDASYIAIDSKNIFEKNFINDYTLNVLSDFSEYGAIFLNDDPNWYTVYNELKIINKNNKQFPLVFICHNIFPNKRRDSYIDPNIIPSEFRNEFSKNLIYGNITISDDFYHAVQENTPKNGVLTALEDFLDENKSIGVMGIRLVGGITILYPKNSISKIRIGKLEEEIVGFDKEYIDLFDSISEKNLLINQLSKVDQKSLEDYKMKIEFQDSELNYKDSLITSYDSKLNLKDSQIKNIESKLFNQDNVIENLNKQITALKFDLSQSVERESNLNNQIKVNQEQLNNKENIIFQKDTLLNSVKRQYTNQLSKLDTKKYCISCYKDEIDNNRLEISYLRNNSVIKKFLSPFSYLYLIFKSNPKELLLNIKLYKSLKNSKCFDIGYYLNNNKDLLNSNWCKYFSPELHYVCNGFDEERMFNKKYFNRNSKEELLEYILNCNY